jgi:hypothetical protein
MRDQVTQPPPCAAASAVTGRTSSSGCSTVLAVGALLHPTYPSAVCLTRPLVCRTQDRHITSHRLWRPRVLGSPCTCSSPAHSSNMVRQDNKDSGGGCGAGGSSPWTPATDAPTGNRIAVATGADATALPGSGVLAAVTGPPSAPSSPATAPQPLPPSFTVAPLSPE